ncbi:hypothetical protein LINPERPRIM_LOCUS21761 [Linum perenne]
MNCRCFAKLCRLLAYEGGLRSIWNIEIDEMVAIFLYTIAHNEKNHVLQVVFRRSGETISRVIHLVLLAVLKLHKILYHTPKPIAEDSTDPRWKYFKRFPGAKGLNKKPFPYYDQLARIFRKDRVVGGEFESPEDADNPHVAAAVNIDSEQTVNAPFEQFVDAASAFDDEASHRVLESMINQRIDGRNMAATSKTSASTRTSKRPRKEVVASGMTDEIAKLHPLLEKTASSIERMVNSICHDDDI